MSQSNPGAPPNNNTTNTNNNNNKNENKNVNKGVGHPPTIAPNNNTNNNNNNNVNNNIINSNTTQMTSLFGSTGIPNAYTNALSASPDSFPSFFNPTNVSMTTNEWDWSNNLIEFPSSSSSSTPAISPSSSSSITPTLPQVAPSMSPPSLSPTSEEHGTSSPQSTISATTSPEQNQPPTTRKRRKREINLSPEMYNIGFEWTHYNSPASTFQIYDSNTMQNITNQFDIVTHKVESNTHFSPQDNAWICYRQNQFKVVCFLKCPQPQPVMSISDSGVPKEVHQLCVKLYAIKEMSTLVSDEVRVGMHHVGRARVKKEKQEISLTPFVNGRVEFANVQFEKSNSVKGQQLEYFRLVMAFYAKAGNAYFHIFSKQSPRLIVRSQNPGFYGDTTYNYFGMVAGAGIPAVTGVPGGIGGSIVPDAVKSVGRVGGVTGGVGVGGVGAMEMSGGSGVAMGMSGGAVPVPNLMGGDSPRGDKESGLTLVGVKRNMEEFRDNTYQVPSNNFDTAPNTEHAMSFDSETDFLLERSSLEGWKQREGEGSIVYKGKVGINVANPSEALTVKGNVLVHGDVYKPSDMRIKSQISPVSSHEQLGHIRELKLYDYTVNDKRERGVLAQELQQVMPTAVREVGDVVVDSKVVKNLLTVNERALLYETIGATKQLDEEVESGKQSIVHINTKVDDIAVSNRAHNDSVQGTVQSMFSLFFQEEDKNGTHNGLEEEFVSFGFSLFRMGPARTFLVLGHFIPWIWFVGAMFAFSNLIRRKVLGCICLFLFVSYFSLLVCQYFNFMNITDTILIRCRIAWAGVGTVLLIVNYFRLRKKIEHSTASKTA